MSALIWSTVFFLICREHMTERWTRSAPKRLKTSALKPSGHFTLACLGCSLAIAEAYICIDVDRSIICTVYMVGKISNWITSSSGCCISSKNLLHLPEVWKSNFNFVCVSNELGAFVKKVKSIWVNVSKSYCHLKIQYIGKSELYNMSSWRGTKFTALSQYISFTSLQYQAP